MQKPCKYHLLMGYNTSADYVIAAENGIAVFINDAASEIIGIDMLGEPVCDIIGEEITLLSAAGHSAGAIALSECDFFGRRCMLNLYYGSPVLYVYSPLREKSPLREQSETDMPFTGSSLLGLLSEIRRLLVPVLFNADGDKSEITVDGLRLIRLIGNVSEYVLLCTEKEAAKDAPREAVDMVRLCRETLAVVNPILDIKGLTVKFESQCTTCKVLADQAQIRHLLLHLISNAARYGAGSEPIIVRLHNNRKQCFLTVADHGEGIREDVFPRLFHSYDSPWFPRSGEGFGLGLALVRAIAVRFGGSVAVESRTGHGTKITVSLPLGKSGFDQKTRLAADPGFDPTLLELSDLLSSEEYPRARSSLQHHPT